MLLVEAVRCSEMLLSAAIIQQGAEFMRADSASIRAMPERIIGGVRILLAGLLFFAVAPALIKTVLLASGFYLIWRFRGPYCGGSDTMSMLVLTGLTIAEFVPDSAREWVIGYVAVQLVFSYWQSGWVKIVNPEWRKGIALYQVFAYSAYPVSEAVRAWARHPRLLWVMGWAVICFELLFPLAIFNAQCLLAALVIAFLFHCANAGLFGLNRFVLAWLSAYPLLIWLQDRLIG